MIGFLLTRDDLRIVKNIFFNREQLKAERFKEIFRNYAFFHLQKISEHATKIQTDSKKTSSHESKENLVAFTIQSEKLKESSSDQSKTIENCSFRINKTIKSSPLKVEKDIKGGFDAIRTKSKPIERSIRLS